MLSPTFWAFVRWTSSKIDRVMTISKFDILFYFVTQLLHLWPITSACRCDIWGYICEPILVTIGCNQRPVSRKMWQFHLNMNIEGQLWRHTVTSPITSTTSKVFFHQLRQQHRKYFSISDVKMNLSKLFRNFQNGRHFEVWTSFFIGSPNESWV